MEKNKICYILIFALTFTSLGLGVNHQTTVNSNQMSNKSSKILTNKISKRKSITPSKNDINLVQNLFSDPNGSMTQNVIPNGNFESLNPSSHLPTGFTFDSSGLSNSSSSYSINPLNGSYSGYLETQGSNVQQQSTQLTYSNSTPIIHLNENLNLSLSLNIAVNYSNSNNSGSEFYMQLRFQNQTTSSNFYLSYILSFGTSVYASNSTNYKSIQVNQTTDTNVFFTHNLTADFLNVYGNYNNIVMSDNFQFLMISQSNSPLNTLRLDDLSLMNSSNFQYTNNGNFENQSSNQWYIGSHTSPGYVKSSLDSTDGLRSIELGTMNKTTSYYSDSDFEYNFYNSYQNYYTDGYMNKMSLSFDWKLNFTSGMNKGAYFYLVLRNQTTTFYLYWYLASNDPLSFTNSTSGSVLYYYFYDVPGFNTSNKWNTFSINFYDLYKSMNISNVYLNYFYIFLNSGYWAKNAMTLKVDNLKLEAFPLGDPSFEENYYNNYGSNPATGWGLNSGSYPAVNLTESDVYQGNRALNLSSVGASSAGVDRNLKLLIKPTYFTDFHFKLLSLQNSASSIITLTFDTNKVIYYILGTNGYTFTNDSYDTYYVINQNNQMNIWSPLFRNIQTDINSGFNGQTNNWNLTNVDIYVQSKSGGSIVSLFDSMNFFNDTMAPVISNLSWSTPVYYKSTTINLDATDTYSNVINGKLYYRVGSNWNSVLSTKETGNSYRFTIPSFNYNTSVIFYIVLTNEYGNNATFNNNGTNYRYVVQDIIKPSIFFLGLSSPLTNGTVVNSTVSFFINGTDTGSGVNYLNLTVGNISTKITNFPLRYTFNTSEFPNGNISLIARLFDKAGNEADYVLNLTIHNPIPKTNPSQSSNTTNLTNTTLATTDLQQQLNTFISENGIAIGVVLSTVVYTMFRVVKWRIGKRRNKNK